MTLVPLDLDTEDLRTTVNMHYANVVFFVYDSLRLRVHTFLTPVV